MAAAVTAMRGPGPDETAGHASEDSSDDLGHRQGRGRGRGRRQATASGHEASKYRSLPARSARVCRVATAGFADALQSPVNK
jgi:hypothetical protein